MSARRETYEDIAAASYYARFGILVPDEEWEPWDRVDEGERDSELAQDLRIESESE